MSQNEEDKLIEVFKELKIARHEELGYKSDSEKIYFTVVGMKYRSNHRFNPEDAIVLEKEPTNPKDKNAVRVLIKKSQATSLCSAEHVAYVAREDTSKLHAVENLEQQTNIKLLKHFANSADFLLTVNERSRT